MQASKVLCDLMLAFQKERVKRERFLRGKKTQIPTRGRTSTVREGVTKGKSTGFRATLCPEGDENARECKNYDTMV